MKHAWFAHHALLQCVGLSTLQLAAGGGLDTSWMSTTDDFDGFKRMATLRQFSLAVSKSGKYEKGKAYDCPQGFRWASFKDVIPHMTGDKEAGNLDDGRYYWDLGGWEGLEWEDVERQFFLLQDSFSTGTYIHASMAEGVLTMNSHPATKEEDVLDEDNLEDSLFAGIICMENDAAAEADDECNKPDGYFPDWMETSDGFQGFRQMYHFSHMHLAMSKSNKFDRNFEYTCPEGFSGQFRKAFLKIPPFFTTTMLQGTSGPAKRKCRSISLVQKHRRGHTIPTRCGVTSEISST